jgi:hypothetical protein
VALAAFTLNRGRLWLFALLLLLIPISSWRARLAAVEWGEMVKAAFDVHLVKLRGTFEIRAEDDREAERTSWTKLSMALIYRDKEQMPPRSVEPKTDDEPSAPVVWVEGD